MLTLYTHSLLVELNEHILKMQGNILMKNGYIKDIEKLINVFLKIYIWVFGYTAPNEDNNIQKNTRNIRPNMKNIICLITKFLLSFSAILYASDGVNCLFIRAIFLSVKNMIFIIVVR